MRRSYIWTSPRTISNALYRTFQSFENFRQAWFVPLCAYDFWPTDFWPMYWRVFRGLICHLCRTGHSAGCL